MAWPEQHALDMSTAVSMPWVCGVKAGDFADMAGSDVVINSAGMPQGLIADRMEMLPKNIPLVRDTALRDRNIAPRLVITATNPVDPLNYATWLAGGFDRQQRPRLLRRTTRSASGNWWRARRASRSARCRRRCRRARQHAGAAVQFGPSRRPAGVFHRGREAGDPRRDPQHPQAFRGTAGRAYGRLDLRRRRGFAHPRHPRRYRARSSPLPSSWTGSTASTV